LGGEVFNLAWLQNPEIDWRGLLIVLGIAIPTYILASSIMFTVGSIIARAQDAQAVGPLLFIVFMLPSYAIMPIGTEPNGTVAVAMSLFPFTALTTFGLRNLLIAIPLWQFALSFVIQSTLAGFALWLASKSFRLGMLRYGQSTRLGDIFRRRRRRRRVFGESSR
jgi:ABC-2 type transport system permease protein